MKCFYCRDEMEDGYIQVHKQQLSWIPVDEKPSSLVWKTSKNGVKLGKFYLLWGSKTSAFCCKTCKIVLIEF